MKYGYCLTKRFGIGAERFPEMEKISARLELCVASQPTRRLVWFAQRLGPANLIKYQLRT